MTSTLQRRPGTSSLRAIPTGWVVPEGTYAFVLGCDEPGREGRFLPGDKVRVDQFDTYDSARFIRCRARLRGPDVELPSGWYWEAAATVFADDAWTFEILPGQTRDLTDLAINTVGLGGGSITLGFELRLVGPGTDPENVEIPAFYLDALILDEATDGLIVANRSPEPGAIGVPQDEAVQFDLMDTTGEPDPDATQIWVDGVLVWDGTSGATVGYTVTPTNPYDGVLRFRIVAPYLFESLREVPVRVVSANVAATHEVDETWSFGIEDLTAPVVLEAVSRSHQVVRVVFDEDVTGADVASAYSFERLEAPSVSVEAVSVEAVSASEYDVTLDIPITRGTLYRVVVSGVEDSAGNEIIAPGDRAEFRGYECPETPGRRFELWEMIPKMNRREDVSRDLYKTIAVLQEVVDLLLCDIDRWTEIIDVDVAAERYLDQMLIGLGNPFDFDLDPDEKRRLIRVLVDMYKLKGTAVGIIAVIRFFLGIEVEIAGYLDAGEVWVLGDSELGVDTFLGPSSSRERFSFEVRAPFALTEAQRTQIAEIVDYMKPAHTHHVRTTEPETPTVIDHLELGLSELGGDEWMLH